jgi:hypothetical protein
MKINNFIFPMLIAFLCISISPAVTAQNDILFISEILYANAGSDAGLEAIEVTGTAGLNLEHYYIYLYNGSNGKMYGLVSLRNLTGVISNQDSGFGTSVNNYPGTASNTSIENGMDGMALVFDDGTTTSVLEFISYEGSFTATNGPAAGDTSNDINVEQDNPEPMVGSSMELIADASGNWAWQSIDDGTNTFGSLNSGLAAALPIELLDFSAKSNQSEVELNWSTASELNNDYMEIERAIDGVQFEVLGRVIGAGTSTEINHYDLTDFNPNQGVNFYRLKQVDFDGTVTYSNTLSVEFGDASKNFVVYPNPGKHGDQLTIAGEITPNTKIELVDQTGKVVYEQQFYRSEDHVLLNLSSVQAGLYSIRLIQGQRVQVRKLILN